MTLEALKKTTMKSVEKLETIIETKDVELDEIKDYVGKANIGFHFDKEYFATEDAIFDTLDYLEANGFAFGKYVGSKTSFYAITK